MDMKKKEYQKQLTLQYCSIEIYESSNDYNSFDVISKIKEYCKKHGSQYVIMLHDNDFYTENTFASDRSLVGCKGEKKKNHYHCLLAFKYRVFLNDIALAFGIEDRWIKVLKHDYDFDNMIVYCTHIKYDNKAHYSPLSFDTNIADYCMFVYDHAISDIQKAQQNIVTEVTLFVYGYKKKVTYRKVLEFIYQEGFQINEYNKYYRIIKDIIDEHNRLFDTDVQHEKDTDMIKFLQGTIADLQCNTNKLIKEINQLKGYEIEDKEIWE